MPKQRPAKRAPKRILWALLGVALLTSDRALHPSLDAVLPAMSSHPQAAEPESPPVAVQEPELGLEVQTGSGARETAAELQLRRLFTQGLFAKAIELVQEQERSTELSTAYKEWLQRQLPVLKLGWAWQMIREKNCIGAIPLLEESMAAAPQALALKGIGYCYLQNKDWWAASGYLERYLETKPSDPEAYILLAEGKESLGNYDEALQLTQKARELETLTETEAKDLEKRESSLTVRAKEGFDQGEMQVGYFLLRYQIPDHQNLVQGALEHMQATVQTLAQQLGVSYPPEGIEVIFHRAENFRGATHSPNWAGGLYDGRIRIPIAADQEMDENFARVLRHEVTHALLSEHSQRNKLPTWFQEGLAQVAECPQLCWSYRFAATAHPFLTAERLAGSFLQLSHAEAQTAYKQSFYMMQVLNRKHSVQGIRQMIEQIPTMREFTSDSLLNQIGKTFAELHEESQRAWLDQKSF